jgi:2-oxoglutarate ferredoxin oxidoreductase subunit beta
MSFMQKPRLIRTKLPSNDLGLTVADYEGAMSTLCAGCGHDAVTAGLVQAFFDLNIEPHRVAKMSGIGCSSKTPAYFLRQSHGINTVHGRMPSVATGANAANRDLHYVGISGDGDSLSIGFGQLAHALRRNVNMLYVIENNGVYGLTKGQFSASADVGSTAKRGDANQQPPIDPVSTLLSMGATFVARAFSGDKEQLVPLLKAGINHRGFGLIDVISPCVTFNDHPGSTKSYSHTREYFHPAIHTDFVPPAGDIVAAYRGGESMAVEMHNGGHLILRKVDRDYDPTNRAHAHDFLARRQQEGEVVTGLLYVDESKPDMHEINRTTGTPLNQLDTSSLTPGSSVLEQIMAAHR